MNKLWFIVPAVFILVLCCLGSPLGMKLTQSMNVRRDEPGFQTSITAQMLGWHARSLGDICQCELALIHGTHWRNACIKNRAALPRQATSLSTSSSRTSLSKTPGIRQPPAFVRAKSAQSFGSTLSDKSLGPGCMIKSDLSRSRGAVFCIDSTAGGPVATYRQQQHRQQSRNAPVAGPSYNDVRSEHPYNRKKNKTHSQLQLISQSQTQLNRVNAQSQPQLTVATDCPHTAQPRGSKRSQLQLNAQSQPQLIVATQIHSKKRSSIPGVSIGQKTGYADTSC